MLGPVDYIAVGFEGNKFNGKILSELQKVVDQGLIRVIDLLFVIKDENGKAAVLELENMPEDVAKAFNIDPNHSGLLSDEDALGIAEDLDNNSSAGLLVFEHVWAKGFKKALLDSGGVLLVEGRVPQDNVVAAQEEVEEIAETKGKV